MWITKENCASINLNQVDYFNKTLYEGVKGTQVFQYGIDFTFNHGNICYWFDTEEERDEYYDWLSIIAGMNRFIKL